MRRSKAAIWLRTGRSPAKCNKWLSDQSGLPRAAGALLHRGPGDGGDPRRRRPRRRGHHALVHLRLHRQRLRAARRDAGVRRHPARHPEPRRDADRGAPITPRTKAIVAVHYAGVGCEMDAIMRDRRDATSSLVDRGRRPGRSARPTGASRSARFGAARGAQLPRDQERHLRRGRRAARQRSDARRARRDHPREGHQPQPSSSAARSTSTPGWTWAPRSCRAS